MKKILVTGANGQLGKQIKALSDLYSQYEFIFTDRFTFSLDNFEQITAFFRKIRPDYCINCAAYTSVDKAERETEIANVINNIAVGVIADCCTKYKCNLIHISTDYVFGANSPVPLNEKAAASPINIYGKTKLEGEFICLKNNPNSIIIRTSWLYSEFGVNFVKTIIRLMNQRDIINVVNDQIGTPTYAADLGKVILNIIYSKEWIPGIYNYSNEGAVSWFDFALDIKTLTGSQCIVNGVSHSIYPTIAKRPDYSLLDKNKIKKTYNVVVPYYKDSLAICIKNMQL